MCHNIENGIKPGSNSKSDRYACCRLLKSCMLGHKVINVRCINRSYNNMAKGIRLLDTKSIFVYSGKIFIQVRAFENNIPLSPASLSTVFQPSDDDSTFSLLITMFLGCSTLCIHILQVINK